MAGTLTSPRTVSVAPRPFPRTIMARILLIDDDDLLRELLATTLAHAGHTVHQAAEGGQGCEIFRTTPVDLVITDIIMPGAYGGFELARRARAELPDLRIVLASGYAGVDLEGVNESGLPLLEKPYRRRQVVEAVRAALDAPTAVGLADLRVTTPA